MRGGLPGNSFVLVEFEEGGGVSEIAALAVGAVGLDRAKGVEAFLELDEAMGVDDVGWWLVIGGWWLVGELLDELGFGGRGGLVFVDEAAAMVLIDGRGFGGEEALSEECCLPAGVRGPVECWELARLTLTRAVPYRAGRLLTRAVQNHDRQGVAFDR